MLHTPAMHKRVTIPRFVLRIFSPANESRYLCCRHSCDSRFLPDGEMFCISCIWSQYCMVPICRINIQSIKLHHPHLSMFHSSNGFQCHQGTPGFIHKSSVPLSFGQKFVFIYLSASALYRVVGSFFPLIWAGHLLMENPEATSASTGICSSCGSIGAVLTFDNFFSHLSQTISLGLGLGSIQTPTSSHRLKWRFIENYLISIT